MFELDLLIVNTIKGLFINIGNNEVLALQSLNYIIVIGLSGIGISSFLEARSKVNKKR